MALETCFQVSTMSRSAASCCVHLKKKNAHHHHHYSFVSNNKEKFNLPTCKGLKNLSATISGLSSSPSSTSWPSSSFLSPSVVDHRCLRSRIVCKAREAVDEVVVVTETSWENEVIASERPALVEFWAPWCGPCRMIAPVIEDLAKTYAGKIVCYKVNTDDCPNIATKYGIRSIPTVLFFKNGEKKESVIGAVPLSTLTAAIEKYLDS
ncbi:thioredoxin M-type, chloroplastic-like [Telopea speciosissima]|uniref:thioredoxin M-type, chloroplastic-like n=1 Tax=Telopea speciosissima TaxID=54955 RepID=UPI001CC70C4A|nr:thioredoxin M-type, chloroplastic-like [Telopea speciosissima]